MSQTKTLPLVKVVRRAGESAYLMAEVTLDTISTVAWDTAPTGATKSSVVTTTTTTACIYTFTLTGISIINCKVVTVGGETWEYGWQVYVKALTEAQ